MAKYTINDTTLVAIADAIRAKSGTTGGIDPANMAALIAAIESGGGGSGGGFTWGTVVPEDTASMDYVAIEHGLGKRPACFVIFVMPDGNTTTEADQARWSFSSYNKGSIQLYKNGGSATAYTEKELDVNATQKYWDSKTNIYSNYAFVQQVNQNSFVVNKAIAAAGKTHVWIAFENDFV